MNNSICYKMPFIRIAISWYNKEFLSIKNTSFSHGWCILTLNPEKSNYKMERMDESIEYIT